ncbi:LysR substrate-binding domain-containing protein [Ramlibacter sp.]|uniref:LysR substrate-binding domain-containing protein n=1 Tax=Ramlibacter sp. TaxID=1917967 RepID=UPI003D0B4F54
MTDPADALLSEAHRLRHFVVLVEERHYGRAAERLGMDQPALSRSIVRLEQALGAQLLVRSARSIALTPAGEIFEKEARTLIAQAQLSGSVVRRVQNGEVGNLRIGFTPVAMFWALPEAVRKLRVQYPDIRILMQEAQSYEHVERLREGTLDVAFVNGDVLKAGEFRTLVLERARVLAAVPASWPAARAKRLRLIDLAPLPFIIVPNDTSPTTHQATLSACRAAGFVPTIVPGDNTEVLSRLGMVASGFGVMLTSEYTRALPVEGVAYVPVVDLPEYLHWQLVMAWDPRAQTSAVRALADICAGIPKTVVKRAAWRGRAPGAG